MLAKSGRIYLNGVWKLFSLTIVDMEFFPLLQKVLVSGFIEKPREEIILIDLCEYRNFEGFALPDLKTDNDYSSDTNIYRF